MKIEEHKAILQELNSDTIDSARKFELINKLSDDYTVTQAEITTTSEKLSEVEKQKSHFAELSQKLWLENSAQLTNINTGKIDTTPKGGEQPPKITLRDLMSKF